MSRPVQIAPSILSADFTRLGEQIREAEAAGADAISIDVMDGRFVPPITFGPLVVAAARRATSLPLEAHLMIEAPERQIAAFVEAGAQTILVHVETTHHLHRLVQQIREAGARAGVTLNPATPLNVLDPILPEVDQVQVMSVNPGWGGQAFLPSALDRIRALRASLDALGSGAVLEVDGGVNAQTIGAVVEAGADLVVAGSAVFNDRQSVAEAMAALRAAINDAGGVTESRMATADKQEAIRMALSGGMYRIQEIRIRALAASLTPDGRSLWAESGPCRNPGYLNGTSIRWHVKHKFNTKPVYVQETSESERVSVASEASRPWKAKTFTHLWGAPDAPDPLSREALQLARVIMKSTQSDFETFKGE